MALLPSIKGPRDLDGLSTEQLRELSAEIREFLVGEVARSGGHLGPNLGVVELTLAIHRVFDSPKDSIVWDTGHQSYVHKLVTGRQDFSNLRARGGLAGYPQRSESEHDIVESSHASSSLSWADGISRAFEMTGQMDRHVVAVVGDGSLTGGMTWEALNNISHDNTRNLVIVVNDNGRSYAPTIGGIARYLDRVRTRPTYRNLHFSSRKAFAKMGPTARAFYRGVRGGIHGFLSRFTNNQALYANLDIKYLGPVDGHDIVAMQAALRQAKNYGAPVIVHAITEKGRGYAPARDDDADQFHAVGQIDPDTGLPLSSASKLTWTDVFGDELVARASVDERLVAITGAMLRPTGLWPMAQKFPDRSGRRPALNALSGPRDSRKLAHGQTHHQGEKMALSNDDVLAGLAELINDETGIATETVQLDKSFTDDLDIDSISMMTIVVNAEEKFDVKIPDDEVKNLKTVGDAVSFITAAAA
jgi:1-deoxy-D-xylulose-5-phosphate synthase